MKNYLHTVNRMYLLYMKSTLPAELKAFALAFCNDHRIAILFYLEISKMAMNITIVRKLKISQAQVSRHLQILHQQQLIRKEKIGKRIVYTLNSEKWNLVKALVEVI